MSWADAAAPVVAQVIRNVGRSDMKALRKALIEAYPWGSEQTHLTRPGLVRFAVSWATR